MSEYLGFEPNANFIIFGDYYDTLMDKGHLTPAMEYMILNTELGERECSVLPVRIRVNPSIVH